MVHKLKNADQKAEYSRLIVEAERTFDDKEKLKNLIVKYFTITEEDFNNLVFHIKQHYPINQDIGHKELINYKNNNFSKVLKNLEKARKVLIENHDENLSALAISAPLEGSKISNWYVKDFENELDKLIETCKLAKDKGKKIGRPDVSIAIHYIGLFCINILGIKFTNGFKETEPQNPKNKSSLFVYLIMLYCTHELTGDYGFYGIVANFEDKTKTAISNIKNKKGEYFNPFF